MTLFIACLMTVVTETAFFALVGYRELGFLGLCVCVNAATNLTLNLTLGAITNTSFWVYPLELGVLLAEYAAYALYGGRSKKLFLLTLSANALSYLIGILSFGHV